MPIFWLGALTSEQLAERSSLGLQPVGLIAPGAPEVAPSPHARSRSLIRH
jgi:hypothetical protein